MFAPVASSIALYSLSAPCLPTVSGAVLNLPIWIRNTYVSDDPAHSDEPNGGYNKRLRHTNSSITTQALAEARVGTPYQSHLLLFDTGSSTTHG